MRLLLRRRVQENKLLGKRIEFVLWARFELSDEERALVRKYDMERGYLTIEGSWRDFRRASLYAVLPALVLSYLFGAGFALYFLVLFGSYAIIAWIIYEQIREAIKMIDIINGRDFKSRSAILMIRRERRMIGYAAAFIHLLEMLKKGEGTDIVEIGEEHEGALRLVTDTYAPA
jgi:hypothetical protein